MPFARARVLSFPVLLVVGGLVFQSGCQQGGPSGPTGTVTGKVTLAGKPVPAGSTVTFLTDSGSVAAGKVEADGAYQLAAAGKPQVPAGKYRVMVADPGAAAEMSQEEYDKMMQSGANTEPPKAPPSVIPAKYSAVSSSGLSYEVKAGANTINIELQ